MAPPDSDAAEINPSATIDRVTESEEASAHEKNGLHFRTIIASFSFLCAFGVGLVGVCVIYKKLTDPELKEIQTSVLILRSFGIIALFTFAYTVLRFGERLLLPISSTIQIELAKASSKKSNDDELLPLIKEVVPLLRKVEKHLSKGE